MMDFSPSPPKKTLAEILKDKVKSLIWTEAPPETRLFPVQQLNVWTPDHVIWSLRIFSLVFFYKIISCDTQTEGLNTTLPSLESIHRRYL